MLADLKMEARRDARSIANALIHHGIQADRPLTSLQVVKLTYFCHGWMMGLYDRGLSAQPVEAWQYGPVIPDVYHAVKVNGRHPIHSEMDVVPEQFDEYEEHLIGEVFDKYGQFSGIQLSQLTHAIGTPWHQVWTKYGRNAIIPDPMIHKHFLDLSGRQDGDST